MRGSGDIVLYSGAFVGASLAAGLFAGRIPAAVFILLVILALASAVLLAITRLRGAAVAAFIFLGACGAAIGSPDAAESPLKERAARIKSATATALARVAGGVDTREGAILAAIAIGDRTRIDRSLKNDFRASGAMHLIALSGLHVGVLYFFLTMTFAFLGNSRPARWARKGIILALLWSYAYISGMSTSIMRAVIMITVYEAGEIAGSRRDLLRALAVSAFISTVIMPEAPFQIGFQLSYGAMFAIYWIFPRLHALLECRSAPMEKLWSTVSLSISCQIMTSPLVLLYFGNFPRYFMVTNFVAIPLTSAAIYLAPVALLTENLPLAGEILSWALNLTLKLLLAAIEIIASL